METVQRVQRLCSEIQLFDLCELDLCGHKDGRYCTQGEVLERFEAIKEEDEGPPLYLAEEPDDELDEADDADFDEAFDVEEFGDEEP